MAHDRLCQSASALAQQRVRCAIDDGHDTCPAAKAVKVSPADVQRSSVSTEILGEAEYGVLSDPCADDEEVLVICSANEARNLAPGRRETLGM